MLDNDPESDEFRIIGALFRSFEVEYDGMCGWMRPDRGGFLAYGPRGECEWFGTRGSAAYAIAAWLLA